MSSADDLEEIPEVLSPTPKTSEDGGGPKPTRRRRALAPLRKPPVTSANGDQPVGSSGSESIEMKQTPSSQKQPAKRSTSWLSEAMASDSGPNADELEQKLLQTSVNVQKGALQRTAEVKEESESEDTPSADQRTLSDASATAHSRQSSTGLSELAAGHRPSLSTLTASVDMRQRARNRTKSLVERSTRDARFRSRLLRRESSAQLLQQQKTIDVEDDEHRLEDALAKSVRIRSQVEKQITKLTPVVHMPSLQQQYDFFTKVYDKPKDTTAKRESAVADEDVEQAAEGASYQYVKGVAPPYFDQLRKEAAKFFYPSTLPVPTDKKVTGAVRRVSEEGLYTGPPLELSDTNRNIWENRFVHEDRTGGWFDDAGRIKTNGIGLAAFPVRLEFDERVDVAQYCKATQGRRIQVHNVYQLDIDLSKIIFTHYSLFSKEHVLTNRLIALYRVYARRRERNLADQYAHQLKAVKITIEKFLEVTEDADNSEQLRLLRLQAKQLRKNRNDEMSKDTRLLQELLSIWKNVERVRVDQSYTCTPYRLTFTKEEMEPESDQREWEEDLMDELFEIEDEFYDHLKSMPTEQNAIFNTEAVWQQIVTDAVQNRRKPGEAKYTAVLDSNGNVTASEQCPTAEQHRRQQVQRAKVWVRIFFNNLMACETPTRALNNDDLTVTFGQIHTLHVHEQPQTIHLKIYEKSSDAAAGSLSEPETLLATVGLPVPEPTQISTDGVNALDEYEFSSDAKRPAQNTAVGSGVEIDLNLPNQAPFVAYTSGRVQCSVLWSRDQHGTPMAPPTATVFADDATDQREAQVDLNTLVELKQMFQASKFDPNDPVNSKLAAILRNMDLTQLKSLEKPTSGDQSNTQLDATVFRTIHPDLELCSEEEFYADQRFRLFELRRENVPEFRALRMVPPYASRIDTEIFERYRKRLEKEREHERITGLDSLRAAGYKYALMMKKQIQERFISKASSKAYEDIVREPSLPEFGLNIICAPVEVERPLRPVRKETRRGSFGIVAASGNIKVLVNIQSATNIPTRNNVTAEDENEVEPSFEVTFQHTTVQSSIVVGKNPTWQQLIQFDFKAPNDDFTPENLKTVTDLLYLNLYDNLISKLPRDDREGTNTTHEQIEKRWLGSIKLPFSTLYYNNGKIEGVLRIKTPPVFLGYNAAKSATSGDPLHPYVKVLLAIEPPLPLPEPPEVMFETVEEEHIITQCNQWSRDVRTRHAKRRYVPIVLDTHGRSVLVCRYLQAIQPPPEVLEHAHNKQHAAQLACHIVSMIPFVADSVMYPGLCDIWCTCEEFLMMLCGDEEEHAILLCCWLMHLDIACCLVLGNGLPEGPRASYVLVNYDVNTYMLYNASDGQVYNVKDAFCPLVSIGTIVTKDNVYGNIQRHDHPFHMSFNLSNTHDWRPLFRVKHNLDSVQPSSLTYTETDAGSVQELRGLIEREIKLHFDQWRPHGIPQWDFNISRTLRDLLPDLEARTLTPEAHAERLSAVRAGQQVMTGFPLNMPYESVERVLEAVRATNVHVNFDPGVEFAIGVYVHAYHSNILSLWVYIASVKKDYNQDYNRRML